jgi:phosphohistidine phosphatase SixA
VGGKKRLLPALASSFGQKRAWLLAVWFLVSPALLTLAKAAEPLTLAEFAARPQGQILFMRHALAPGGGDPPDFALRNCASQRNLDATGRAQAAAIGKALAAAGIQPDLIASSQWCRCLETARLLGLGPVMELDGLNSFFQNIVPRKETLAKLRAQIDQLPEGQLALMVTHFVTIQAITGLAVGSGEMVVYDRKTGAARRLLVGAGQ